MKTCPRWASAPGLAGWNAFQGYLLSLGTLCLPSSSGPGMAGEGCSGGHPGTVPGRAGKASPTLHHLPGWSCSPGRASPAVGLGRGISGGGCGLAPSWGCSSLGAKGQASLAGPQLRGSTWGMNPCLGGSSRHRDGGGVVWATSRIHVGHPIHGRNRGGTALRSRRSAEPGWGSAPPPCRAAHRPAPRAGRPVLAVTKFPGGPGP